MIARYDNFGVISKQTISLCNPGSYLRANGSIYGMLGVLSGTEAEENVFNFNAPSELNFRISLYKTGDDDRDKTISRLYDGIENRRLLYQEGVGFFEIVDVTDGFSDQVYYKDVSARSIEVEFEHRTVPYVSGTNPLEEVLHTIVDPMKLWTIDKRIDRTLLNRYRTIDSIDEQKNCLSFLLDEVQNAYDCIIEFDIEDRVVTAFDKEADVRDTGIYISREDLIESAAVSENSDALYTALRAVGENNLSIHPVNPTGSGVMYDFSYYLNWMPEYLRKAVKQWQAEIAAHEIRREDKDLPDSPDEMTFTELSELYYGILDSQTRLRMDIEKVEAQKKLYESCFDTVDQSVSDIIDVQKLVTTVEAAEADNDPPYIKPPTPVAPDSGDSGDGDYEPVSPSAGYTDDDLTCVAIVMCQEAGGESDDTILLLVANVIMNRVSSKAFPNTIRGVLTQKWQYEKVTKDGGKFYWPDWATKSIKERCYRLAKRVLDGERFCPANVVYQAAFKQGSGTYAYYPSAYGGYYFCYA